MNTRSSQPKNLISRSLTRFASAFGGPNSNSRAGKTHPKASKLAGQPLGQRLKVKGFTLPDGARLRLLEMGLTEGIECRVVRYAPLGDPMEVHLRDYFLSLRASEAEGVHVELAD